MVRYGVVLDIGTLGVVDATIGVSDTYIVEDDAVEVVDVNVTLVEKKPEVVVVE